MSVVEHSEVSISNTGDSVSSGYPNTEKRVENTTHNRVPNSRFLKRRKMVVKGHRNSEAIYEALESTGEMQLMMKFYL